MDIIFFGSSDFAVPSLKSLLDSGQKVRCVVTQPDRPKGRGLRAAGTSVKETASEYGINIYQPQDINSGDSLNFLKGIKADLFIVIAYGQILSSAALDIPGLFSVNIHASLLPEYRGAAPVNWAIIKGERSTGVSAIKMVEKMDAGPVLGQKKTAIGEDDNALTLEARLSELSAELLLQAIASIERNDHHFVPQDEGRVTFAPKLKKEDGLIDWERSAADIRNLIRGCLGWPGAFTCYNGKLLKILKSRVGAEVASDGGVSPGRIMSVSPKGIAVAAGNGNLLIEELQMEGKRPMSVSEFIVGHKIHPGEIFSKKYLHTI
ncbi:MAG: methionyl-tRNA formyltransferase [Candidatus Omnitrophota bacterium]|jgi:methionyl-tRNA formyltransferase